MRSSSSLVLIVAALGAAAGCSDPVGGGNTNPPVDSGMTTDTGSNPTDTGSNPTDTGSNPTDTGSNPMDTGTVTPTDGGTPADRTAPVDSGPPVDPCAAGSVVDLNTDGMRTGATTRITRSNAMAPRNSTLRPSCGGTPTSHVAFRYTPTATGRLSVSTDNAGTMPNNFDTVVWALGACAMPMGDAGNGELGCNDDNATAPRTLASRFTTTAAVTAGTPIFILVAGYASATVSTGTFELSVTEIATVAAGGMCDVSGATSVCATGSLCVGMAAAGSDAGATMGTCVADGGLNGACRMTGEACNAGLGCSGAVTSTASRCRTTVALGAACDSTRVMNVCAAGSTCITASGMSTCVAAGAVNAACRPTGMACDAGLACNGDPTVSTSRCRTSAAVGAACDSAGVTNACVAGSRCLTSGGVTACVADGTLNGACRATGTACDGALGCSGAQTSTSSRCRTVVAVGAACDTARVMNICAAGANCVTASGMSTCRAPIAAGGACAPGSVADVCAMGTACLPTSGTAGTCSNMTTAEMEPNNTPAMAQAPITASRIYTGAASSTDADCFRVTVPMGAGIFAESSLAASTTCASGGPDPVIEVYNPAGMQIASADDSTGRGLCGTLNPASTAAVRNLAAGTYTVCIEGFNTMTVNYLLTIGIIPPG